MHLINFTHHYIQEVLQEGDIAVDATVGNGFDTLFLAKCVGKSGKVIGFDVQSVALAKVQRKISPDFNVALYHCGHQDMQIYLKEPIKACMFNLGYLPYSDKEIITQPDTTLKALEIAYQNLAPKGRISLLIYRGHQGGRQEQALIETYLQNINAESAEILKLEKLNMPTSPIFIGIEKR